MFLDTLKKLDAENLHHAYCVEGAGKSDLHAFAEAARSAFGVARRSPDFVAVSYNTFGVDEAHELAAWAANAPTGGAEAHKFFVIATDAYTHEAQNALLKTCEEPAPRTHFFLLISRADALLPTLRSRLEVLSADRGTASVPAEFEGAAAFLAATPLERLTRAEKFAKNLKDEKITRSEVRAFITTLLALARGDGAFPHERTAALRELAFTERYAHDRSTSFKLLLEHLAVVLPKM